MPVQVHRPPGTGGRPLRAAALGLAVALAGCVDPAAVRDMPAPDDPFLGALRGGYLDLAEKRAAAGDAFESSFYADKARAATRGVPVGPERLEDWTVAADERGPLLVARARLSTSLAEGQRKVGAPQAAEAQVMFDCWLERQEGEHDAAPCRDRFWRSLGLLEDELERRRASGRSPPPSLLRPMHNEPRSPS